jgi:parvulin-like peptidyl-prolyl isomerase
MDYLAQGFYDEVAPLNEEDLKRFYDEHKGEYKKSATATFTHVFISKENRGSEESKIAADTLLNSLNQDSIPFDKAGLYGERFWYNRNYVKRDTQEIASHFGADFNQQLFDLEPSLEGNWQGPIQSDYGWHLVLLTRKIEAYIPPLIDIGSVVLADAQRQQQHELKRAAINELMAKYQVIDPDNPE